MKSLRSELSPLALGLEFLSGTITLYEGHDLKTTDGIFTRQNTVPQSELNIGNIRDTFLCHSGHTLCMRVCVAGGLKRKHSKLSHFRFVLHVLIKPHCLRSDVLVKKERDCHTSLRKGASAFELKPIEFSSQEKREGI